MRTSNLDRPWAVALAALVVSACGTLHPATPTLASAATPAACPPSVPFAGGIAVIRATRVFTGANGESDFEAVTFQGESKAYFRPGELFSHNTFGAAKKVQLVSGPPGVTLPPHPSPYREMFLTLQGASFVTLPNGRELALGPGDLVIFDDMTSHSGHGGRTGPCGYVALNIVPADPAPAP